MRQDQSVSEKMADFALSFTLDQAPPDVLAHGKSLLVDTFGVAAAAYDLAPSRVIEDMVRAAGSNPEATLWGGAERVQLCDAVLYNAALIHGTDFDDTHVTAIMHPSAAVLSMAVSVGERVRASGRQVLEAIVVGWEIICRLALAAAGKFHDVGYHCTGIVAPFAAACVGARLMGLSREQLTNALGLCGSQAAALQEFLQDGTWSKKIHPGWGCHAAVYALRLAQGGFLGPRAVIEGRFGIWNTHLGDTAGLDNMFDDFGAIWHTRDITYKLFPVCHFAHAYIDCMLALREEHGIAAGDIARVDCFVNTRCSDIICTPREAKINPETANMMRFSLPFLVACAAVRGRVSPWEIDLDFARSDEMRALMPNIHCILDESVSTPRHMPGKLTLTLKDGRTFTEARAYEPGAGERAITREDVLSKYYANVEQAYENERAGEIVSLLESLEHEPDMQRLLALLRRQR